MTAIGSSILLCWLPRDLKCIILSTLPQNNRFLHDNQNGSTVACKIVRSVFYQQWCDAACALDCPLPDPTCSSGVRCQGINSKDPRSRWETVQQAPLNTTAGSLNTVHPCPIGPKKTSLPDWLALSTPANLRLSGSPQLSPPAGDVFEASRHFMLGWPCPSSYSVLVSHGSSLST